MGYLLLQRGLLQKRGELSSTLTNFKGVNVAISPPPPPPPPPPVMGLTIDQIPFTYAIVVDGQHAKRVELVKYLDLKVDDKLVWDQL